ncbi:Cytochrome P450 [Geosmithia morbida]|uniref:Cytochrome P450 n=1 Tax=Geosmithia morbida TaxID=1094350 RepID=A0A9P4YZU4_9HYPO|nr:Cytochrome P450 [Geosmithia morbida]KAF4124822.1 Cytochrome P450 [Geosmithia morbida]
MDLPDSLLHLLFHIYSKCTFLNVLGAFVFLVLAAYLIERFITGVAYPPSIPLIREPEGARSFSLRTRISYYTECKAIYEDAWNQYLKHGRPVVVPGIGSRKEVILPPEHIRWALAQPESRLSVAEAMAEVDQAHWSLGHAGPVLDSWQGLLIKTELNRSLETICSALSDELGRAFDKHFGTDTTTWREIDLRNTITKVVAQANSRFTVGLPLCRNEGYLQALLDVNDLLITVGGFCSGLPHVLRPFLGGLLSIPMKFKIDHIKQWLVPLWDDRIRMAREAKAAGANGFSMPEPTDHVQAMARYALRERPNEVDDYELIVRRICAANFGAVHQTVIQVTNLLLNIIDSDHQHNTIATLLDESDRILSDSDPAAADSDEVTGQWTKGRVNRMVFADSASRETLRLQSFANRSLIRKVMTNDMATPDGHPLPKGTIVSFLVWPSQTNPDAYEDPLTYDPFRFARSGSNPGDDGSEEKKTQTFVTTSQDYLAFGHGKHACPGRFIVDFELKMIINHVLRYYDVRFPDEYEGKKPPNDWMCEATFPPRGVRICVRRKA